MRLSAELLAIAVTLASAKLSAGERPPRKIDLPVPIGHEVKGLRVPLRTIEGKMDIQLQMESATRLDQQNVQMRDVAIQTFDQQTEKPDVKIDLKTSVMNLETNVIKSETPILVTRADFRITGDGMEFNSKTRQGRVVGNVHMTIYNHESLQKAPPATGQPSPEVR
jgi:Lipopolysaccharide-assembly, LptC-related